jgi:3-dehydroquinate synthase
MDIPPLSVTTPTASYHILVGPGLLARLPAQLAALDLRGAVWLISDTNVYPRYGGALMAQLRAAGYPTQCQIVPAGETSKNLTIVSRLYDWLISGGIERRDTLLALGGGVVGDLAGFVAGTILRGVALVQLPTTLLAMVDSAIGGKTGVNHPLSKNLIGTFHHPRLVLSDTDTLASLPPRELRSGWAEAIKHGVIRDAGLFEQLEGVSTEFDSSRFASFDGMTTQSVARRTQTIGAVIRRAAAVKVALINADEHEAGDRILLNYGHTIGHALEVVTGYGTLLHGEAVAIGMHLAAQIAARLDMIDTALVERQRLLLHAYGLPTSIPPTVEPARLLTVTLHDKKVHAGRVRWVLPTALGVATTRADVPEALVRTIIASSIDRSAG